MAADLVVTVTCGESVTVVYPDGRVESRGDGRPVAELLRRLRAKGGPAAAVAMDPTVARLAALLGGRVEEIAPVRPPLPDVPWQR